MGVIERMRKKGQYAVYWEKTGTDRYNQATYVAPKELEVRWEDRIQEFVTPDGEQALATSVVYVGENLVLGGFLWEGRLDDITNPTVPSANPGAREIRRFDKLPKLNNREVLRTAYL